jgi:hypothetical protein
MSTKLYLPKQKLVIGSIAFGRPTTANGLKSENETTVAKIARAIFDWSLLDNTGAANSTVATHPLGVYVPINSIITRAWYEVKTAFTTASSNTGTIGLYVKTAGDCVAAIAVSDASTPYAAGMHGCLPGNPAEATVAGDTTVLAAARAAASYIAPLSAEGQLTAVVGLHALTAGRLIFYVEYVPGE